MNDLPRNLLFACTRNAVRSPMAEAVARRWLGSGIFIDSAGVEPGLVNPFAVAVMDEISLDIRNHEARTFEELSDYSFDLIVAPVGKRIPGGPRRMLRRRPWRSSIGMSRTRP